MPPLTEARRQEIRTAIQANRKPTRGASNRTILVTGAGPNRRQNKYVVLADGAGKLTPAGIFYYQTTGAERPRAAFSQDQELISRGGNDYIRTRDRREALVRSLRPDGTTRVTQLGRAFFKNGYREFVVHVPVIIRGSAPIKRGPTGSPCTSWGSQESWSRSSSQKRRPMRE